jgi:predicted lipoprotein with Yx(FWY)xxD motif
MSTPGRTSTILRSLGLTAAAAMLLAACNGSGGNPTVGPASVGPSAAGPSAATSAAAPSAPAAESAAPSMAASPGSSGGTTPYTINLTSGASGTYLTGTGGMALYVYKKDSNGKSACTSSNCVANWPPFTVRAGQSPQAGDGVTGALATFKRADGKKQISYNGQPLYYFAGDTQQGDTNGANVSPDWSLAAPKVKSRPGY